MPKSSTDRVKEAAEAAGLTIDVRHMPTSTRTAEEAAQACGCKVGQIVKSLIFQREASTEHKSNDVILTLALIAGNRQADLDHLAATVGAPLKRADPKLVRQKTGFAIGGVAPIGHLTKVATYMDPTLHDHALVWAAAGAPNAVFAIEPQHLQAITNATLLPK